MNFCTIELYEIVFNDLMENLSKIRAKDLSILIWCLCKANKRTPKVYGAISLEIENRIKSFQAAGALLVAERVPSNDSINLEKKDSQIKNEDLSEDLEDSDFEIEETDEVASNTLENDHFSCQSISMILWCFTKKSIEDADLFEKLGYIISENIQYFSLLQLSNILYGLTPFANQHEKVL